MYLAPGGIYPPSTPKRETNDMLAIIGGTGLTNLASLEITRREVVRTPYG